MDDNGFLSLSDVYWRVYRPLCPGMGIENYDDRRGNFRKEWSVRMDRSPERR